MELYRYWFINGRLKDTVRLSEEEAEACSAAGKDRELMLVQDVPNAIK